jgi:phospholipase C
MLRQFRFSFSGFPTFILVGLVASLIGCAGIKDASSGGNNGGGSIPQPAIASFTSTPSAIESGQTATLTWTSKNATAVTLNGAAVDLNGSTSVKVTSTTIYTLVATGASGTTPANATATVTVNPKIVSFKAAASVVVVGQSTTLTWETVGATSVNLNGSSVNASGTSSPVITQDTTFTLTANGGAQPVTQSITVKATTASLKTSVNHIVLMMQENRSFDHYFGHLNDYRAKQGLPTDVDDLTKVTVKPLPTWDGSPAIAPYRMKSGCIEDLSSSWQEAHNDVNLHSPNEGSWGDPPPMNGFAAMAGGFAEHTGAADVAGKRALGYYTGDDLPFYYWAATTFGTSDRWFSGALTRTQPNRMYFLAATSNGYAFPGAASNDPHPPMFLDNRKNIFQLLQENNITWKVYVSDVSYRKGTLDGTYLSYFYTFGNKYLDHIVPLSTFKTDAAAGTLPQVALLESDSGHDEHPLDQIDVGMRFVWDQVNALMNSPSWNDSIFILTYDEGGGLYDHVPPVSMPKPDDKNPILVAGDPTGLFDTTGFRVPLLVISPFTKPGFVSHTNADFTAALKLIETRFDLPSLTERDKAQMDMTEFFDWTAPNLKSTNPPVQTGMPCYYILP